MFVHDERYLCQLVQMGRAEDGSGKVAKTFSEPKNGQINIYQTQFESLNYLRQTALEKPQNTYNKPWV
jgi:hypothetical protein